MKYLKNIVAVLVLVGIFHMSYSAELSVDEINVLDANTVSVILSDNPNLEVGEIEAEIRVLNDVKLRGAFANESDTKEVEIILEDSLKADTSYSLLTVLGADGSIDFTTPSSVEGFMASNVSSIEMQDIDTIEVIDDRTIIVTYRDAITSSSLEYKLLAESKVTNIEKPDFYLPEILISIEPPFISENDYILMFIEMQDASGEFLEFDTGIYDFESPVIDESIVNQIQDVSNDGQEEENEEILEIIEIETPVVEEEDEENIMLEDKIEEIPDLEAAGQELGLGEASDKEMLETQEAAMMVTQTPDTGAQTWVLIMATLLINSFYYLSRRKKTLIRA